MKMLSYYDPHTHQAVTYSKHEENWFESKCILTLLEMQSLDGLWSKFEDVLLDVDSFDYGSIKEGTAENVVQFTQTPT